LRADEVIVSVDGMVIRNENHLINRLAGLPVGSRVRLQVWRDRRALAVEALVGDWNQAQARLKVEK
jgi:S1-C subfamily serine protease